MHSVTDRQMDGQTDGRQDDANSRSYCIAVWSAKNQLLKCNHEFHSIFSPAWSHHSASHHFRHLYSVLPSLFHFRLHTHLFCNFMKPQHRLLVLTSLLQMQTWMSSVIYCVQTWSTVTIFFIHCAQLQITVCCNTNCSHNSVIMWCGHTSRWIWNCYYWFCSSTAGLWRLIKVTSKYERVTYFQMFTAENENLYNTPHWCIIIMYYATRAYSL